MFKAMSGSLKKGDDIYNVSKDVTEKAGNLLMLRGKQQIEVPEVVAGDIGVLSRLQHTQTADTLSDKDHPVLYKRIKYPEPTLSIAVEPKAKATKKDRHLLQRLIEEDPSFSIEKSGNEAAGHLRARLAMYRSPSFWKGTEKPVRRGSGTDPVAYPYRETIKGSSSVQGRHRSNPVAQGSTAMFTCVLNPPKKNSYLKKSSAAQYPSFFPAVEKGIREAGKRTAGRLSGCKSESRIVRRIVSRGRLQRNGLQTGGTACVQKRYGRSQSDSAGTHQQGRSPRTRRLHGRCYGRYEQRRGRILGMEPQEDGNQLIIAEAPHAELFEYAIDLRSMTQARGSFKMEFALRRSPRQYCRKNHCRSQ